MKRNKRRGFTLIELVIVIVLMSLVASVAVSLITFSAKSASSSEQLLKVTMSDADFITRMNNAIKNSGTSFTIPEGSFTVDKLTAPWSYVGLMHDVRIPANISRTGAEIDSADALVYIEYAGSTEPASLPQNSVLLHNSDGYFIQTILGHSYTDVNGIKHTYSLVFNPTDPSSHLAQSVSYSFSSERSDGEESLGSDTSFAAVLNAMNAIQVVYQGSSTNPATAIAFVTDFVPTSSSTQTTYTTAHATVAMVIDLSGSMDSSSGYDNYSRLYHFKTEASNFIRTLSQNPNINVLLTTFGNYANQSAHFTGGLNAATLDLANAYNDKDALLSTISKMKTSSNTNLGDGLRIAYYKLQAHPEVKDYPVFLLMFTDGEVNYVTRPKNSNNTFYTGNSTSTNTVKYVSASASVARNYLIEIGGMIEEEYHPTACIINIYKGMSETNRTALKQSFSDNQEFNANSLTSYEEMFTQIYSQIEDALWAFNGPRL